MTLGLEVERAKGLLVLGQVLAEQIKQGFGLLRAEKNRSMVADGDLVGGVGGGKAEG